MSCLKKIVFAVLVFGIIIGAMIVFALNGFTIVLNLKLIEAVDWGNVKKELNLYIAPAQTLNLNEYLGQIHQRSDRVKYCISVEGDLSDYKVILRLFSLYATSHEAYAVSTPSKQVCATITKKNASMNEIPVDITLQGWIKSRIDIENIEQVKITITVEPQP